MKKLSAIIVAMALLLGMSQCKKENTNTAEGKKVYITMKTDDGDRHIVYPGTGAVVYNNGDVIYVGDGSKYIGTLTYGNGTFGGEITAPDEGSYLYFYFLGGQTLTSPSASTTSYTISIADQSEKLPVLSCGKSTTTYTDGNATYSCMLRNKCALVKFTTPTATSAAVKVSGMKNVATVNFGGTPGITPTGATGDITLYSESNTDKWAVLLPQEYVISEIHFGKGIYEVSVPQTEENGYVTSGVTIGAQLPAYLFSVSDDEAVQFSLGNLQYYNGTWRFAEHQYDIAQTSNGTWNTTGWVDLFGWGTWGSGKNPLNISTSASDYEWSTDFAGGALNGHNDWRTLTQTEWAYLFQQRTGYATKYATATVYDVHGIIILPDNWTVPYGCSFTPGRTNGWNTNVYNNQGEWETMQAAGAVFLPAAGLRGSGEIAVRNVGNWGHYWSSSSSDANSAYGLIFEEEFTLSPNSNVDRYYGYSVRLVR